MANVYVLQDDAATETVRIELSGIVTSAEAIRLVSQAFAFAEAGGRSRVLCNLSGVLRGPGEIDALAAMLRLRPAALRIAFVGGGEQLKAAVKLAQMAGLERWAGAFSNNADADAWLSLPSSEQSALSETAKRHLRKYAAEGVARPRGVKVAEPAA